MTEATGKPAQDRRTAEDDVASAERSWCWRARRSIGCSKPNAAAPAMSRLVDKARDAVNKAKERLDQARVSLRKALAVDNLPAPSRPEAALAAARAELSVAEAALERTRVRAPSTGTILQISAKVGETAAPSPETCCFVIGDLSSLQVRAEIEERDIGKVRVGQPAVCAPTHSPARTSRARSHRWRNRWARARSASAGRASRPMSMCSRC